MIFVTVYFTLAAVAGTLVLKNALLHYLLEARAEGTLIADDGKKPEPKDESDEEEDA
jgi:hypothetical protein